MAEHQGPRPLNRRDLLAGAGTGILAIYLVGCGGSSSKLPDHGAGTAPATTGAGATTAADGVGVGVPGPPATGGTPGGKLVVVSRRRATPNDPAIGYTGTSWDSICNLTFAPLYTYSENNDPQPQCAADLPRISADSLTYTIPLRDGVTFHNGRPVVAEDYAYAWDRVLDPANESWAASYIYTIEGAQERYEDGAKTVTGIKVIDPKTHPGHARAARRHLPLRADAAVHGAGAEGGGREVRQGLPGARRRQRPVQADHVRPGRPDDAVRPAHRLPLAGPALRRPGRVPLGRRPRRADPRAVEGRRRRARRRPRRAEPRRRCGATRSSRTRSSSSSRCSRSAGSISTRAGSRCSRTKDPRRRSTAPPTVTRCRRSPATRRSRSARRSRRTCRASRARSSRSRTTRRRRRPCWPRPASRSRRSTSGWRPTRPTRRSSGRSCSSSGQPSVSTRRSAARRTPTRSTS